MNLIDVYLFRSGHFARNGDSVVCVCPRLSIEAFLGVGAVSRLFFGYVLYRDECDAEIVGVWGRRNASRLRRLLREQGAELLIHRHPPAARLHSWTTTGVRPAKQPAAQRSRSGDSLPVLPVLHGQLSSDDAATETA